MAFPCMRLLCLIGSCLVSGPLLRAQGGTARLPLAWAAGLVADQFSSTWPALPADAWTISASDYPDGAGAVILKETIHFHRRSMDRFRRLLILSKSGRSLAEFQLIGANVKKLEGRTVTPDGNSQPFVQNGDIVKAVLLSGKRENLDAMKVIPPGVTEHCIVDVRWTEPIDADERPVPDGYDYNLVFSLSGAAPVRVSEIIFDDSVMDFGWQKKFEVQAGQNYRQTNGNGSTTFTFTDISARPKVPLASEADLRSPVCNWFLIPQVRDWLTYLGFPRDKPVHVLDATAKTIFYKFLAEPVESKRGFKKELKSIGQGIDGPIRERSVALIRALRGKMKTISELPSLPNRKEYEASMVAALKRGWGTHAQLCMVGFHLLRENGLDASLVFAIDREDNRLIDPSNIWQYDYMLLAVPDESGEPVYLNPGSTFHPVGAPPWTQASQALVIHPGKERLDWTGSILHTPASTPEASLQTWKVAISPGAESDGFQASFQATGHAASQFRVSLSDQHAASLDKGLQPLFQQNGFILRKAEGTGTGDPWGVLSLSIEGVHEHEGGRRRLILPFPFLQAPFQIPSSWPATRTIDIHLPMKTLIDAEARMKWQGAPPDASELEPLVKENTIGRVVWKARMVEGQTGTELVVNLQVRVNLIAGGAGLYSDVKSLAGWIQDAVQRGIPVPNP